LNKKKGNDEKRLPFFPRHITIWLIVLNLFLKSKTSISMNTSVHTDFLFERRNSKYKRRVYFDFCAFIFSFDLDETISFSGCKSLAISPSSLDLLSHCLQGNTTHSFDFIFFTSIRSKYQFLFDKEIIFL
jgi:hypothetical protein